MSRTALVDFQRLIVDRETNAHVLRLMMAFNDLQASSFCNFSVDRSRRLKTELRNSIRGWTIRAAILQAWEAMELVEEVRKVTEFDDAMRDPLVTEGYKKIQQFLHGGNERSKFVARTKNVRDWTIGHYDHRRTMSAMSRRASHGASSISKCELSSEPWCTRFYAADRLSETIIIREAFQLTSHPNEVVKEFNVEIDWLADVISDLQNFILRLLLSYCPNNRVFL